MSDVVAVVPVPHADDDHLSWSALPSLVQACDIGGLKLPRDCSVASDVSGFAIHSSEAFTLSKVSVGFGLAASCQVGSGFIVFGFPQFGLNLGFVRTGCFWVCVEEAQSPPAFCVFAPLAAAGASALCPFIVFSLFA